MRNASVPHENVSGFIEKLGTVHHERGTQAWNLSAIGNDADAGCLRLLAEPVLLSGDVRVASQIAHVGFGLEGGPRDFEIVAIRYGTQERVHPCQKRDQLPGVGDVQLNRLSDRTTGELVDSFRCSAGCIENAVGKDNAFRVTPDGHVVGGRCALASRPQNGVSVRHVCSLFIFRSRGEDGRIL